MRLLRCCLVLLAATTAEAAAVRLLAPSVAARESGFEAVLVSGCAAVACGCAVWGWLATIAVVVEALGAGESTPARATPGVPATLRRLVLAGCGVALSAGVAPALATPGADTQQSLPEVAQGLPFPSRAMDLPARSQQVVVVRPGDSLWAITEQRLPAGAADAEITHGWQDLYARNRAVVGDDPSLIRPGQHLVLPDHLEESS
jgi:nucleoid-associated protein YgaU